MATQTQLLLEWHQYVRGLRHTTHAFYAEVEETVKRCAMPDMQFTRVEHREGGFLSAKREYLRIKRGELYFDLCGAQFGNGFFVSERLFAEGSLLEGMGTTGLVVKALVKPDTMYRYDTALVMKELVHDSVLEVVDGLTNRVNLPAIPESARLPVMQGFLQ